MNFLTKSSLAAARACQRLYDLTYVRCYRPAEEAHPLRFGTLVHAGLETLERGGEPECPANSDPWDMARARPMLRGYRLRWDPSLYEVLGVEQEFECPLVNPATGAESKTWRLAGKLDAVVREIATGRILIKEHKTSSQDISPGAAYWARLRMDAQVSIYFAGAKSLGYDVSGVLYDVLGKPRLRPYEVNSKRAVAETPADFEIRVTADIAENPARYYQRGEVVRLESELADAMVDIWQQAQQMREAERLGRAPRNPDACEKWGRLCSFFPVCSGEASLEGNPQFVQLKTPHPELAGAIGEA